MSFEDQVFLERHYKNQKTRLDRIKERADRKFRRNAILLMGVLASYGMLSDDMIDTVTAEAQFASNQAGDQIQEGDIGHQRILENETLEPNPEPEGSEFINNLIQEQYNDYNTKTAEFYLTLEKNDPDGEIRNLIAELGEKYGDPENIITYQAIAAVESRYIWERSDNDDDSDDDGVGYFQITNIPESVQRKVRKIAERDGITDEKKLNIIKGILTYKHYRKHVENLNNGDTLEEQKYRAAWEYNAGYIVDQGTIKENINKYKDVHRYYGAKIGAWEIALTEGYRH